MVRTQIQLSDELYREVKRLANEKEWSLADVLRRGAEYMVRVYPDGRVPASTWRPPKGKDLGRIKVHYSRWREIANQPDHFAEKR